MPAAFPLRATVTTLLAASAAVAFGCGEIETPAEPARPNFLVILADDLGYTDIGAFGGEIRTPNLDRLADSGLRFTSFYTAATCSPTRAMLLSGVDHHLAGLGGMASLMGEDLQGRVGYEGYLNEHVFHLPQVLREAGYFTGIAGKWHLGDAREHAPPERGFDRSFVLLSGAASHFEDAAPVDTLDDIVYRRDGEVVAALPEGFYSTRFHTDELISYLDEAVEREEPFFLAGTYTAPHWPLQVPDEYLDLYAGAYDDGWEALAARRMEGAKRAGVIPAEAEPPPLPDYARRWEDLTDDEQRVEARKMELYAAMVERLDHHVGRLVAAVEAAGRLQDTIIVFLSDNGAAGEDVFGLADNETFLPEQFDLSEEAMGRMGSFVWYGFEWAHAGTAPFRYFKQFVHEGGIRVPGFAVVPERWSPAAAGAISGEFVRVTDLFPTILDFAGIETPSAPDRITPTGRSLRPLLTRASDVEPVVAEGGWEIFGRRAFRRGRWKAVWGAPPAGDAEWALYDLEEDPGELRDLARERPEILEELLAGWERYVDENGVIVTEDDRGFGKPVAIR